MKDPPSKQNVSIAGVNTADAGAHIVNFGAIAVDLVFRRLCIEGEQYELSPKEFILVYTLLEQGGKFVSRKELCTALGASADDSALENHIHRLRKKWGKHSHLLSSKRNCGYRMTSL